jgi:protease I
MKKILAIVDDIYEDLELWYPKVRLEEAGHIVEIAGAIEGQTYKGKHGYPCKTDVSFDEIHAIDFDGLLIPGGYAPDKLRRHTKVLDLVREFNNQNKLIGFICHAGWVLISAKILKGRKATSTDAIRDDMENAGALWENSALVIDRNLISSRTPLDLPLFGKALVDWLNK